MNSQLIYLSLEDLHKKVPEEFFGVIDVALKPYFSSIKSSNIYWISEPESKKDLQTYADIIQFFLNRKIQRSSTLYVIGGGATSDLGGFVASTILRGINWIVVPTTLLSMVDASIGGKVGVNHDMGKNLIGSFYTPQEILINTDFLKSLPVSERKSGEGEILKYALLNSTIADLIMSSVSLEKIILACSEHKLQVVARDFLEMSERKTLNLGHTIGHGLEKLLSLPHGVSVVFGMILELDLIEDNLAVERLRALALKLGWTTDELKIPSLTSLQKNELKRFVSSDKKRSGNEISMTSLQNGKPEIIKISVTSIEKFIDDNFNH